MIVPVFVPMPVYSSAPMTVAQKAIAVKVAGSLALGVGVVAVAVAANEIVRRNNNGRSIVDEYKDMWRIWKEVGAEMKAKREAEAKK